MKRSSPKDRKQKDAKVSIDEVMKHHRAWWRIERVSWALIALILIGALLGIFGTAHSATAGLAPGRP